MTGFHSRASCQQYLRALLQRTTPENRRTPHESELTVSCKFTLYVLVYLSCRGICIFELATFYARRIIPHRPIFAFYRRSIWLQQSLKCLLWRQNVNYVNVSKYLIVISLVVSCGLACGSLRSVAVSCGFHADPCDAMQCMQGGSNRVACVANINETTLTFGRAMVRPRVLLSECCRCGYC